MDISQHSLDTSEATRNKTAAGETEKQQASQRQTAKQQASKDGKANERRDACAGAAEKRKTENMSRGIGCMQRAHDHDEARRAKHDDDRIGAVRKRQLRDALEKDRRVLAKMSNPPPPAHGSSSQFDLPTQPSTTPIAFTPLRNCGQTCFLNAALQFLRAVCDRLGVAVPVNDTCPAFRLPHVPAGAHENFKTRVTK